MAYTNRRYIKGAIYEICIRTKQGLPFACNEVVNSILVGILARANRNNIVSLCHFIYMGNHAHMLVVLNEPSQFQNYYAEIMKKTTETFKALMGLKELQLWEKRPSIIELVTPEDIIERIAYFYSNPAKAGLVKSIQSYPGLSSWDCFMRSLPSIESSFNEPVKWYRYSVMEPLLKSPDLLNNTRKLHLPTTSDSHTQEMFVLRPNAWMEAFDLNYEEDIKDTLRRIKELVVEREQRLEQERQEKGNTIMGVNRLLSELCDLYKYKPKSRSRRLFIVSRSSKIRAEFIVQYKAFCKACSEARKEFLNGVKNVVWPIGAFVPWMPVIDGKLVTPGLITIAT